MPRSGSRQCAMASADLLAQDLPRRLGQAVALLRVEVDGVEHRPPDVVLLLGVGAVADPDGLGALVAVEVVERDLGQRLLAADPVHDLQVVLARGHVADEVEEVVGLLVEAERVEAPQREGRVADPREAVVPVALAARGLGQRRRGGRADRARRRVGQPLEGQGAALEVPLPRVVGEVAVREPLVPEVGRVDEAVVGLVVGLRALVLGPRERDEGGVAVAQRRARPGPRALEAEAQVGRERDGEVARRLGAPDADVVARVPVGPLDVLAAVVEHRLAVHVHLDEAVDAAHRAQQDVVGVVVGRRPAVRVRAVGLVVPRADEQDVADDDPARPRAPRRLEDHRAGEVAPAGRDLRVDRAEAEAARVAVQELAEDGRAVHARQAHPLDVPARRHERRDLAVGQERVVGDGREGAAPEGDVAQCAALHRTSVAAAPSAGW